jgi:hypothetical protein
LVACVVSKKFIKFLRKSLKEFDLNLKRKVVLKRSLKKKRKKTQNLTSLPFGPARPAGPASCPAPARLSLSLFLFFALADTRAPPVSLSLPPSFSSSPCSSDHRRSRADSAAPRLLPFLFLPSELAN